jgi:hypothetical protein
MLNAEMLAAAAGGAGNFFGDESNGSYSTNSNDNWGVPSASGYNGEMVVRQFSSFYRGGGTLSTNNFCRGMFIMVTGNFDNRGTINMKSRGACASSNGQLAWTVKAQGYSSTQGSNMSQASGTVQNIINANSDALTGQGSGWRTFTLNRTGAGNQSNGSGNQTGGGGRGATAWNGGGSGGWGNYGGPWSGGAGGGGARSGTGGTGQAWGCRGGNSRGNCGGCGAGGGAGNGNGGGSGPYGHNCTDSGVGGLIIILVGGNFYNSGTITCQGSRGCNAGNGWAGGENAGGGGSGGGQILIMYGGSYTNNGSISANGGSGGWGNGPYGSSGGRGTVQIAQIDE